MIFFCSAFIDYIKGRFEAIKDIYSPYQIKLHLSSFCCVIVPLQLIASYKFFLTGPRGVPVATIWEHQLCSISLLLCFFMPSFCVFCSSSIVPSMFFLPVSFYTIFRPSLASYCSPSVTLDPCSVLSITYPLVFPILLSLRIPPSELSSIAFLDHSAFLSPLHLILCLSMLSTPCTHRYYLDHATHLAPFPSSMY